MTKEFDFDLVVLGGGPGGYTAAFRAADLGQNVCLVEKHHTLGGVCLNVGCIPSKTLLHAATLIEEAQAAGEFGISFSAPDIDLDVLKAKKTSIINKLTGGLEKLAEARGVKIVNGVGRFSGPQKLSVEKGNEIQTLTFRHAIIATGSRPFNLPGLPDSPMIWDSTDALTLLKIPDHLLIIGGGIIGLEMAQVYHALGSNITVVEMLEQIIPPADKDMVQPLFLKLKKRYEILTKSKVTSINEQNGKLTVSIEGSKEVGTREVDAVLVAVGRVPNSENLNLDEAEVTLDDRGYISVDSKQRTSNQNIFAIGDVVGDPMLAHKATHQGKVAAEVIAGHPSEFDPMTIPSVAYTYPEVAWMGMTEKQAKAEGIDYQKGKFGWGASGRALSSDVAEGSTKALFDKASGRIIGAAICGANAGELIHEAILALEMGADAEDISKTIHAHPTLAETFAFAAEIVDGSITDALPPKK